MKQWNNHTNNKIRYEIGQKQKYDVKGKVYTIVCAKIIHARIFILVLL